MANLALVYGMRLFPASDLKSVGSATVQLVNGSTGSITMHLIEGSKEQIEQALKQSLDAFFDLYPEI